MSTKDRDIQCSISVAGEAVKPGDNLREAPRSFSNNASRIENIDASIEFFAELGLDLAARIAVEGDWADASLHYAERSSIFAAENLDAQCLV